MKIISSEVSKSLILVTVDCLRADHVGFMGDAKSTTPFLDSLAKESCVFRTAIAAGAPTYFSVPAILASRYPLSLGRDVVGIAPGETTLASVLQTAGYATACFSAANPYISELFGYHQGFDVFEDFLTQEEEATQRTEPAETWKGKLNRGVAQASKQFAPLGAVYDELYFQYCQGKTGSSSSMDELRRFPSADVLVSRACAWIDSLGNKPFFLWLHLMDPHAPYYPADQAIVRTGTAISPSQARYLNAYWNRSDLGASRLRSKKDRIVELYDAGVYWVDTQLSRLVQKLMSSQRWHDCAFALTADHGEEFLDHGGRFHAPYRLYEELIHVPLMMRVPERICRTPDRPFSLLHLAPTLLNAVGVAVPEEFSGVSHWPSAKDQVEWCEPCISEAVSGCTNPFVQGNRLHSRAMIIRDGHYKMHVDFAGDSIQLFNLEVDPLERAPIPDGQERAVRRNLLEIAHHHLQQSVNQRDTHLRLRSKLRDLQLQWPQSCVKSEYAFQ